MSEDTSSRVRSHFVTVQLTLLSIVVALVLENLLSRFDTLPNLDPTTAPGALTWLQGVLVVACALASWAGFGLSLVSVKKAPRVIDFLVPFALLAALQLAVRYMHPAPEAWFLTAAGTAVGLASLLLWIEWRDGQVPLVSFLAQASLAAWLLLGAVLDALFSLPMAATLVWLFVAAAAQTAAVYTILWMWQRAASH